MKVQLNQHSFHMSFLGQHNDVIGFDDSVSQARRNYIREHYTSWNMPHQDIYEREGRLEEYDLNRLIKTFVGERKAATGSIGHGVVDFDLLDTLPIFNGKQIGETNSYRGSTLASLDFEDFKKIKKAGIENVIDLRGFNAVKDNCEKLGINYLCFREVNNFWLSDACYEKAAIVRKTTDLWKDIHNADSNTINQEVEKAVKTWEEGKNSFIESFISFIRTMQKDFVIIGCEFGTYRTDNALLLNHFFNPQARKLTFANITAMNIDVLRYLKVLYENLNTEQKARLGWDAKFDKEFLPYLAKYIRL